MEKSPRPQPNGIDSLSDRELLDLAAEGQRDILCEGVIVSPLVYRLLGRRGLSNVSIDALDNPNICPSED